MFHYRKNFIKYQRLNKHPVTDCSFCEDSYSGRIVEENEHAHVIRNRVAYDLWETREVIDHLLVVPKQHVTGLAQLSDTAKIQLMEIFGRYEKLGYHVYARGQNNSSRSQHHQHTHLIRTKQKPARLQVTVTKPHILVKI